MPNRLDKKENLISKKTEKAKHIPVLLKEIIESSNLKLGDTVLDGTVGGGGYFLKLCEVVGKGGVVIGIDQDSDALVLVKKRLKECKNCCCRFKLINNNFRNLDLVLKESGFSGIKFIVLDIGLSSLQFEESKRGFSFQRDEPLLMTFQKKSKDAVFTAKEIVNFWEEENIADVLYGYGGEKFSRRIAKNIIEARKEKEIKTTFDLVEIIEKSIPSKFKNRAKIHPATKTFQALRIAVNDELGALKEGLEKGFSALEEGGRMTVVSFHSSEDRIVKNFMREKKKEGKGLVLYKKPIIPKREEVISNPRSRSAKLRTIEKISN